MAKVVDRWFSISDMAAFLGMSVPAFRALHQRLGSPFQEKRGDSKTAPIYINSRKWLEHWRGEGPDDTARMSAIKLRNLELDLEERELRHAKLKQTILEVEEVNEILVSVLGGVGRVAERLDPEGKRMLANELREARDSYQARFNGHSDQRLTNRGGSISVRACDLPGHPVDKAKPSRVRKKIRDDAPGRPDGGPKVSG